MEERTRSVGYLLLLACTAAVGGFLFGFDTAVINGAVRALQAHFGADDWSIGLAVSSALLASAAGALIAGPLADRVGRRPCMVMAGVLFFVSAVGSGVPMTLYDFMVWRVIGGVAVGAASVIAPAYIAEVAPAGLRGRLGSLQQLAIVVGIFVALLSNYFIALVAGGTAKPMALGLEAWRWMFWVEAVPALVYVAGALIIPESPRYLVARGKDQQAAEVLGRLLQGDAQAKIAQIRATLTSDRRARVVDLLGPRGLLPVVWVGLGLSVLQQFVGINVIFYYSSVLWQAVGFTEKNALAVTMITGLTNIVTTVLAIACIDRLGRRPLLLIGSIGMTLTLGAMALVFLAADRGSNGAPQLAGGRAVVALVAANAYVFCFGFSWGPVVWVLLGEMFSNRIRAIALSVAAGAQWVANFVVSTTFPPMVGGLGVGFAYGTYTVFAALSIAFVVFFVQETKGRALEQMGQPPAAEH